MAHKYKTSVSETVCKIDFFKVCGYSLFFHHHANEKNFYEFLFASLSVKTLILEGKDFLLEEPILSFK